MTVSQWHQKPYWCRPMLSSSQSLRCLWRWRGCQEKRTLFQPACACAELVTDNLCHQHSAQCAQLQAWDPDLPWLYLPNRCLHDLCSQSDCIGCRHPCSKQAETESWKLKTLSAWCRPGCGKTLHLPNQVSQQEDTGLESCLGVKRSSTNKISLQQAPPGRIRFSSGRGPVQFSSFWLLTYDLAQLHQF